MDAATFIGKTLKEVKEIYGDNVRVRRAGKVSFPGTCDFKTSRLNVELDGGGLKFETKELEMRGKFFPIPQVMEDTLDSGIVTKAHFG